MNNYDHVIESLAEFFHNQWIHWMKYMIPIIEENNEETVESINKWKKQMKTPYKKLTNKEKESDREQVDKFFDFLGL